MNQSLIYSRFSDHTPKLTIAIKAV